MEYVISCIKPATLYLPGFDRRVVVGAFLTAALAILTASSYVSRPHFAPALLGDQPQPHSWSASMAQSKSGVATTTFSIATSTTSTSGGYPTDPSSEGIISRQAAAAIFDRVSP